MFPITKKYVYLNVANHCPPSLPVQDAVREYLNDWDKLSRHGDKRTEEACVSFGKLINAQPHEVCAQPNTSAGLTAVAETLKWKNSSNVVVNNLENSANLVPWLSQRRRGVDVRIIKCRDGDVKVDDVEKNVARARSQTRNLSRRESSTIHVYYWNKTKRKIHGRSIYANINYLIST